MFIGRKNKVEFAQQIKYYLEYYKKQSYELFEVSFDSPFDQELLGAEEAEFYEAVFNEAESIILSSNPKDLYKEYKRMGITVEECVVNIIQNTAMQIAVHSGQHLDLQHGYLKQVAIKIYHWLNDIKLSNEFIDKNQYDANTQLIEEMIGKE